MTLLNNEGYSWVVAFIFMMSLALFGVSFLGMVATQHRATYFQENSEKAYYIAEAGVERKMRELKTDLIDDTTNVYDAFNEPWADGIGDTDGTLDGTEVQLAEAIPLGDGKYQVQKGFKDGATVDDFENYMDEQGKINVNYANIKLLGNLFTVCGVANAPDKATEIYYYKLGDDGLPGTAGVDDDDDGSTYFLSNGIDDDGDGFIDDSGTNNLDDDGDGFIDEADEDEEDMGIENDGLDNDGDGEIDEYDVGIHEEGIDEDDEFQVDSPYGDDRPYRRIEDIMNAGPPTLTDDEYDSIKDKITVYSLAIANSLYANNQKVPYALAPRIVRPAVPRAPVNINTADLEVLTAVLMDEGGSPTITQSKADEVARKIIEKRTGGDNVHDDGDDDPFDTITEFESFIDALETAGTISVLQRDKIKDNANPSACSDYEYGYSNYTTEFFFFFTTKTNADIASGNSYDASKDKFYFTSKAFKVRARGDVIVVGRDEQGDPRDISVGERELEVIVRKER